MLKSYKRNIEEDEIDADYTQKLEEAYLLDLEEKDEKEQKEEKEEKEEKEQKEEKADSTCKVATAPCLVIYVKCHGKYAVNDNMLIDEIPAPLNRNITYLKVAEFNKNGLTDYHFLSNWPKRPNKNRYDLNKIKSLFMDAYETICINPRCWRNKTQMESRKHFAKMVRRNGIEKCRKQYGTKKAICVSEQYSQVPFLQKFYSLDKRQVILNEYGHGIFFMTKINNDFKIYNISIVDEFLQLLNQFNITLRPKLLRTIQKKYSPDGKRILRFTAKLMLELIDYLPPEYTNIKYIDETCSPVKHGTQRLKGDNLKTVLQKYRKSMISQKPTTVKGGRYYKRI